MNTLIAIIISVLLISLISLIGVLFLALQAKTLDRFLLFIVAFASGSLLGGAFLHLLPEALESTSPAKVFMYVLCGILVFFVTEKFLHWRHCHHTGCEVHSFAYMNLVGDSIHNFIDGLIIASSYLVDMQVGIVATTALIFHEIPQEIGDFGVLLHGGFSKKKAILLNVLTAMTALVGALVGYYAGSNIEGFNSFLLPFAAGGFIYVANTDLFPELHKKNEFNHSIVQLIALFMGILLMWLLKNVNL
ncbi:MAG: ZIP family metal transporter [Methanosarcinaceae archaeon]|nr:ZIP family metal transporter [Methanosarcinaceae archaeon]